MGRRVAMRNCLARLGHPLGMVPGGIAVGTRFRIPRAGAPGGAAVPRGALRRTRRDALGFRSAGPRQASVNDKWPNWGQPPRDGGFLFRVSFENPCAHRDGLRTLTVIPPGPSAAATVRASPWEPWHIV